MSLRIYIHEAITEGNFPDRYTVYDIHVYSHGISARIHRRYRDVRRLFKLLKQKFSAEVYPEKQEYLSDEAFPPKTYWFSRSKGVVDERIRMFNELFRKWTDDIDIATSRELIEFAGVRQMRQKAQESNANQPLPSQVRGVDLAEDGPNLFQRLSEVMVVGAGSAPSDILVLNLPADHQLSTPIGALNSTSSTGAEEKDAEEDDEFSELNATADESSLMRSMGSKKSITAAASMVTGSSSAAGSIAHLGASDMTLCPILARRMHDAVVLVPCGHSFSDEGIGHWLEKKSTCPVCRVDVICRMPNYALREVIQAIHE
eukprot:TRINITY_DN534_c0_g1_i1.p1 TRINITY_DN534_c0_g1~~TRINITY_DN534_c0_g1_i1.p1  ORF type:complete len:316 (+),score=65.70 TRINITY_DN534_c0_g1_i1:53-1000(+)